jgi:hypothetical protein
MSQKMKTGNLEYAYLWGGDLLPYGERGPGKKGGTMRYLLITTIVLTCIGMVWFQTWCDKNNAKDGV